MDFSNINYRAVKNLKWADPNKRLLRCDVDFTHIGKEGEFSPFGCTSDFDMWYGKQIYADAVAGKLGTVADYTTPSNITGDDAKEQIRGIRNQLLKQSDIEVLPDRGHSESKSNEWKTYRQKLRDITKDYPNAYQKYDDDKLLYEWVDITWPTKPS